MQFWYCICASITQVQIILLYWKTRNSHSRLNNHNCRYGTLSTEAVYLRPFAVMACTCGFEGCNIIMLSIERKWKEVRDNFIM